MYRRPNEATLAFVKVIIAGGVARYGVAPDRGSVGARQQHVSRAARVLAVVDFGV